MNGPAGLWPDELFAVRRDIKPRVELVGGEIPVILIDNVYVDPHSVRAAGLQLDFRAPPYPYPGQIAEMPERNASLMGFLGMLLQLVNRHYLPNIPPIVAEGGRAVARFATVHTDFAVVDVHPDELKPNQRQPHVDAVPVFALLYLNEKDRGGTLFFEAGAAAAVSGSRCGYFQEGDTDFDLVGRIESAFNRLAIYPGFVPHSGDIRGDWISTDERFTEPRLTQRFQFFP